MREACLHNINKFCSNIFENLQGINDFNNLVFSVGGGDGSPRLGALTWNERWKVVGWGLSLKFLRGRVYLVHLKHINTGSTHLIFPGGTLTSYIYTSYLGAL